MGYIQFDQIRVGQIPRCHILLFVCTLLLLTCSAYGEDDSRVNSEQLIPLKTQSLDATHIGGRLVTVEDIMRSKDTPMTKPISQSKQQSDIDDSILTPSTELRLQPTLPDSALFTQRIERMQHNFPSGQTVNINGVLSSGSLTSTPRP